MISRSRFSLVSSDERASERAKRFRWTGRRVGDRGGLGRKDGYDRKSLPRRNWLYKIGSAPGSYTCLLRMQTSSPNAREPHESAPRLDAPTRTVSTDTRPCSRFPPRYLPFLAYPRRCTSTLPVVLEWPDPSRNWKTPLLHEGFLRPNYSSRYESIIRNIWNLFQFTQNIKKS